MVRIPSTAPVVGSPVEGTTYQTACHDPMML